VITERTYEDTIKVPISCLNLPNNLIITKQPPDSVRIKIKGKGKELLRFRKSIKIVLDLAEPEIGWKKIVLEKKDVEIPAASKIKVTSTPTPKSFIMRIEKKGKKRVKIVPTIKTAHKFKVIPEKIEIQGGKTSIRSVSTIVTEQITPSSRLPDTIQAKLKIPKGIRASREEVTVIIESL
jgi:hypothetical protein